MVIRMLVAPAITWLFVSTWPVEVTTMPVPAPCTLPPNGSAIEVLTSTTAGSTLLAMARTFRPVSACPDEGLAGAARRGTCTRVVEPPPRLRLRLHPRPIPMPPLNSTSPARTAARAARPRRGDSDPDGGPPDHGGWAQGPAGASDQASMGWPHCGGGSNPAGVGSGAGSCWASGSITG